MFVVSVIPLIKSTHIDQLSYFSSESYEIGTLLTIPVRGKQRRGIVTHVQSVSTSKASLRSAGYTLRKLPHQPDASVLPAALRRTAEALTREYPASAGALLFHLLPPDVRNGEVHYPSQGDLQQPEDPTPQVLTARKEERFVRYHSHIREVFAHRGSILLVCPTSTSAEQAAAALSHGIQERLTLITSQQSKRARAAAYEQLRDTSIARLIITTPTFAYLDRVDLLSIIVEECASEHYRTRTRPYLDHRVVLKTYAQVTGRSIMFGDTVPPVDLEAARRNDRAITLDTEAKRLAFAAELSVITQKDRPTPEQPFTLFSPRLTHTVTRALEGRGHVLFFGARRGLAPVVACIDCGHIFRCPDSNTPFSLLRTQNGETEERWFVSSTSGRRVRAADVCPICGSWRLRERGIGVQHLYDEWRSEYSAHPTLLFDETTARTPKKAQSIIEEFYAARGAVLIATAMVLPYLSTPLAVSVVTSYDALRSIPSWRADERTFRTLLHLREISTQEVLVQTRQEADSILQYAARGALERFYDDELRLREQLHYPPYASLILCTWVDSPTTSAIANRISIDFAALEPQVYKNPSSTPSRTLVHALFRIPERDTTRYAETLSAVRSLPPFVKVEIDPDRIV